MRGGCTPGNSRRSASAVNSRLWQLAALVLIERIAHSRLWQLAALVLIERIAHVRGGCTPGDSRPWQLAPLVLIKRPTRVRGGCTPGDSRLWQLATARAHREDSARARRGMVLNSLRLVFSHLSGGVWRRPAPRPLRKISPPNGGARGLLFFCGLLWGDLRGLAFSNFFLRSP